MIISNFFLVNTLISSLKEISEFILKVNIFFENLSIDDYSFDLKILEIRKYWREFWIDFHECDRVYLNLNIDALIDKTDLICIECGDGKNATFYSHICQNFKCWWCYLYDRGYFYSTCEGCGYKEYDPDDGTFFEITCIECK